MRTESSGRAMSVIDGVLGWSIAHRTFVVVVAVVLTIYGVWVARRMPVDVFPDLTAPTVTVVTEAHNMAPEEVEGLVTAPIEAALNGQTGVRRLRSLSGLGISIVWVEFEWDVDILRARQLVGEKLQLAAASLPPDVAAPQLAPVSSIMGEILFIGLRSDRHRPMEVRDAADWQVRRRCWRSPGVAQVVPIGGGQKQYQVLVRPERLARSTSGDARRGGPRPDHVEPEHLGGFLIRGPQQHLIRGLGRLGSRADIARLVVKSAPASRSDRPRRRRRDRPRAAARRRLVDGQPRGGDRRSRSSPAPTPSS
jgi:Cu(I)/Ag(I) efflux system membrane protein CusA/SilA